MFTTGRHQFTAPHPNWFIQRIS